MSFTNKVVLVTGASAGIGESIALAFAERHATLVLVGRDESRLKAVGQQCAERGQSKAPAPKLIVADLSTDEGCERIAKEVIDGFGGRLDVLVNNAGVGARTCIEKEVNMENYDRVFNTNLRGVYNLTRLLVPSLIKVKGNIVNISSNAGTTVCIGSLPYGMAKAALDHFTRLIALELASKGVRVNTISPGLTVSKFAQRLTGYTDEEYANWIKESEPTIPMKKACIGDDIASMVVHIASEESRLVTGTNTPIDGGLRFTAGSSDLLKKQIKKNEHVSEFRWFRFRCI